MNTNAVQKEVTQGPAHRLVDSLAAGFADMTVGLLGSIAAEYNRRQAEEREAKRQLVVGLIEGAIASKRRISIADIAEHIPGTGYMSRAQLADKLQLSLSTFNAGVKRWYHIF